MASTVRGACLIERQDVKAAEIDQFLTVLEINVTTNFGDATYKLNQARQTKLRCPEALPKEADLSSIRNYSLSTIVTLHVFIFDGVASLRVSSCPNGTRRNAACGSTRRVYKI